MNDNTKIPTDPKDVYVALRRLIDSGNLTILEIGAVSYAMGVMEVALPLSFPKKES